MKTLLFATQNPNKIKEIQAIIPDSFEISGLDSQIFAEEIPETGQTLKENAIQKAQYVYDRTGTDCFADDTGLEVDALDGAPGVYTARYAGPEKDAQKNMGKLIEALEGQNNRKAQFKTVIALILDGNTHVFEGVAKGKITNEQSGKKGFGYDPIFIPNGYEITFAEMDLAQKNKLSHRAKAFQKLVEFLN